MFEIKYKILGSNKPLILNHLQAYIHTPICIYTFMSLQLKDQVEEL